MTDTPSERPDEPAAPESATPQEAPAPPKRAYARVAGSAPTPATAPGWGQAPAPAPGWAWAGGWFPQPGIIPLRPLLVGDILTASFGFLRRYWRVALVISGCVALVSQAGLTAAGYALGQDGSSFTVPLSSGDSTENLRQAVSVLSSAGSFLAVTAAIGLVCGAVASGLLTVVVRRAVLGRPASPGEAWREARPQLPKVFAVGVVTAVISGGIVALSVTPAMIASAAGSSTATVANLTTLVIPGLVVALWAYVSLSLAAPALMLERQSIREAFARSIRLVRGAWWRIFGITIAVGLLTLIISGFISLPFSMAGTLLSDATGAANPADTLATALTSGIAGFVASTLTVPVSAAASVLLYIDQRIRREALDIDLAAAAGVPNYGSPAAV
ncbi:hypothetical protein [Streptacidiphilus sp. EB129]|uniref:hypothetical protein n=1 Tax=Streptacidiphilus sp. EB129 TaxID=3156262 RepID=UPI00351554A7